MKQGFEIKKETNHNKSVGKIGEDVVERLLMKRGYSIIARNYLKKWGEIDIVALKDKVFYFYEVKTVTCETIRPEENITKGKLKRFKRAVSLYLLEKHVSCETSIRIVGAFVRLNYQTRFARVTFIEIF